MMPYVVGGGTTKESFHSYGLALKNIIKSTPVISDRSRF